MVHGDSLSAAYGMAESQGWVSLLAKRCFCQVINTSQSGETTDGGLSRLPVLLQQHRPDVVVLELGANDGLRGLPLARAEQNLRRMVDLARKARARVLLLSVELPPNYGRAYNQAFRQLFERVAREARLPAPPFLLQGFAGDLTRFQPDGLHPLPAMQPVMLETVWPVLSPLLAR